MSARGRQTVEAWAEQRVAELRAYVVTTSCLFCADFEMTGPVGEVSEAYAQHRAEAHPEVKPKPRRQRRKHQFSSHRNLDDNIAAAREQGAATWAGPV